MKSLRIIAAAVSVSLLSSCGVTNNLNSNLNLNNTSVVLSQANFRVVKTVSSSASATYVFGIGGLSQRALRANAVAELTKKAELKGSQALVNVNVRTSTKMILFFNEMTFYAEGTVIEFSNNKSETTANKPDFDAPADLDKESVQELVDKSELCRTFMDGSMDEMSKFQAQQQASKLCTEIMDDIKESRTELAVNKYKVLKYKCEKDKIESDYLRVLIKKVEKKLGIR